MALMSVPAWPMPIHQTKLMMPKAQATGMLLPHIPMPLAMVMVMAAKSMPVPARPMKSNIHQPRGAFCQMNWSSDLLSVPSSCCPSMRGGGRSSVRASTAISRAPGWGW